MTGQPWVVLLLFLALFLGFAGSQTGCVEKAVQTLEEVQPVPPDENKAVSDSGQLEGEAPPAPKVDLGPSPNGNLEKNMAKDSKDKGSEVEGEESSSHLLWWVIGAVLVAAGVLIWMIIKQKKKKS